MFEKQERQVLKEIRKLYIPKLNEYQSMLCSYKCFTWKEIKNCLDYLIANSDYDQFRKYSI